MASPVVQPIGSESRAHRGILFFLPPAGARGRLQFIDALRGWAVLVMIETHVLNGMLQPGLKQTSLFTIFDFPNGLVAPSFLFAAGMAFAVSTRKRIDDFRALRPPLFKHLGRLGLLFLIGYGLHVPKFEYHHLRYDAGIEAWRAFAQVDVLQCIAASLLIALLLAMLFRSERRIAWSMGILTALIVVASPLVWRIDAWQFLPIALAEYVNGNHLSLFPLFPWAGFVLAGGVCGYAYLRYAGESGGDASGGMKRFTWLAAGMVVASFLVGPALSLAVPGYDDGKNSPGFFLLRLGLVMLACGGLYFYERKRGISASSIVTVAGRASLVVYTVHLIILYGNFRGPHLVDRVGYSLGFLEVLAVSVALIIPMIVLAYLWDGIKQQRPTLHRALQGCVVAGCAYVFFVGL